MKSATLMLLALAISGCVGPFDRSPWTAKQLVEWHAAWGRRPDGIDPGIGYRGTDERFHHFMSRPLDSWVFVRIRRGEIQMPEELPFSPTSVGAATIYYWVDPANAFQKKRPNKSPEPTPTAVTPRAMNLKIELKQSTEQSTEARVAPAAGVAHL